MSFNDTIYKMPSLYSSLICTPCVHIYSNINSPSDVLEQSILKHHSICISLLILVTMTLSPSALCFPTHETIKAEIPVKGVVLIIQKIIFVILAELFYIFSLSEKSYAHQHRTLLYTLKN